MSILIILKNECFHITNHYEFLSSDHTAPDDLGEVVGTWGCVVAAALIRQGCHSGVVKPQRTRVRWWGVKARQSCVVCLQMQWTKPVTPNRTPVFSLVHSRWFHSKQKILMSMCFVTSDFCMKRTFCLEVVNKKMHSSLFCFIMPF